MFLGLLSLFLIIGIIVKFYDKGFECVADLDDGIRQLINVYKIIDAPWFANY